MNSDTHAVSSFPGSSGLKQPYHLVDPSPWPIIGALGGGLTVFGIILAAHYGSYVLLVIGRRRDPGHDVLLVARRDAREPGARPAHRRSCGLACATA